LESAETADRRRDVIPRQVPAGAQQAAQIAVHSLFFASLRLCVSARALLVVTWKEMVSVDGHKDMAVWAKFAGGSADTE
jgi:hypothetical protein